MDELNGPRTEVNSVIRTRLRLPSSFPTQAWTHEEFAVACDVGVIPLDELERYCFAVSTEHSRLIAQMHLLVCCYLYGTAMAAGFTDDRLEQLMRLAKNFSDSKGERPAIQESIASMFPGLSWKEVQLALSCALRFAKFSFAYQAIEKVGEDVPIEQASALLCWLHGGDVIADWRLHCQLVADYFERRSAEVRRASLMHPAATLCALASHRRLWQDELAVMESSLMGKQAIFARADPQQVDKKAVAGIKAFVMQNLEQATLATIGKVNVAEPAYYSKSRQATAMRQLGWFEDFRKTWPALDSPDFFESDGPKELEVLLRQLHFSGEPVGLV